MGVTLSGASEARPSTSLGINSVEGQARRARADCTLVTYAALPHLDPDDLLAVDALRKRGVSVRAAVWNDPSVDWSASRVCVLRSTWDYPAHFPSFMRWLDSASGQTRLYNDVALVRWNAHKFYLRELEFAGVPVVPTAYVARNDAPSAGSRVANNRALDLGDLLSQRGWSAGDIVVKPAHGAGTSGVRRFGMSHAERAEAVAHYLALLRSGDVLVQPYLCSVEQHEERALVFIDGAYSHAVTKTAFQQLLPAGEAGEAPALASPDEIAVASAALGAVPGRTLYARVDLVRDVDGALRVMEVELIEPSLFFGMHRAAATAFADAVARELNALEA